MTNEVSTNLEIFIKDFDSKYLRKGMLNSCAIVQETAKRICPHDKGHLERSIDFEVSEDGTEGVIYSNMEYAPYVEIGTGIYSSRGDGRKTPWKYKHPDAGWVTTRGNRPQPFLKPAVEQNISKIQQQFEGLF